MRHCLAGLFVLLMLVTPTMAAEVLQRHAFVINAPERDVSAVLHTYKVHLLEVGGVKITDHRDPKRFRVSAGGQSFVLHETQTATATGMSTVWSTKRTFGRLRSYYSRIDCIEQGDGTTRVQGVMEVQTTGRRRVNDKLTADINRGIAAMQARLLLLVQRQLEQ